MHRNVQTWENNGKKVIERHKYYDLSITEVAEIYKASRSKYDALVTGYYMGVETGRRAALNRRETVTTFDKLLALCDLLGLDVKDNIDFKFYDGLIKGDRIGLADYLTDDEKCFVLAHEIGHAILHTGLDLVHNPDPQAEEDADRIAKNLLDCLNDR